MTHHCSVLRDKHTRAHTAAGHLPSARVKGKFIHSCTKFCMPSHRGIRLSPKAPALHVDTHPPLFPSHQLNIPHLLHVAGIAACACRSREVSQGLPQHHPPTNPRLCGTHRGRTAQVLNNNEADFTVRVFIATGHHSPNCIVHHGNHVQVKLLRTTADPNPK